MPGAASRFGFCFALALVVALRAVPAWAQPGSGRYSSMVIDAGSGQVLSAVNPDELRYPASLTKMMTLYMLFEALRDRRVTLDQLVPVSSYAASMPPSKLGLRPGTLITVQQAILGLVTKSANDAAAALGELMGGSEDRFAQMMTLRAQALGMNSTVFHNASGLPDPDQVTTARDMAILARHLVQDYPQEYAYFSVPGFVFHGRVIANHDHLLTTYPGADGIKTGFTNAAGHNLVTSAVRGGVRLIGVVLGDGSNAARDYHMTALLDDGFGRMNVPVGPSQATSFAHLQMPTVIATAQAASLAETVPEGPHFAPRLAAEWHSRGRRWTFRHATFRHAAYGRSTASLGRSFAFHHPYLAHQSVRPASHHLFHGRHGGRSAA